MLPKCTLHIPNCMCIIYSWQHSFRNIIYISEERPSIYPDGSCWRHHYIQLIPLFFTDIALLNEHQYKWLYPVMLHSACQAITWNNYTCLWAQMHLLAWMFWPSQVQRTKELSNYSETKGKPWQTTRAPQGFTHKHCNNHCSRLYPDALTTQYVKL